MEGKLNCNVLKKLLLHWMKNLLRAIWKTKKKNCPQWIGPNLGGPYWMLAQQTIYSYGFLVQKDDQYWKLPNNPLERKLGFHQIPLDLIVPQKLYMTLEGRQAINLKRKKEEKKGAPIRFLLERGI